MRRSLLLAAAITVAAFLPTTALGQGLSASGATPLAVDLKKVPVGSWAEYTMNVSNGTPGGVNMKSRWALVARDDKGSTLEMSVDGQLAGPPAGKMTMKMVLAPDPIAAEKPVKQLIMQMGGQDPMEMPLTLPGAPQQKFEKPDPKKLVAKEDIKVAAGSFKASHYRDNTPTGTVDIWINEGVNPLGIVKVVSKPKPGATGPGGQPVPPVTMELSARGKDAKSAITKPPKPFDATAFMGGMGGPPPGAASKGPGAAPPPGATKAPPPGPAPTKK